MMRKTIKALWLCSLLQCSFATPVQSEHKRIMGDWNVDDESNKSNGSSNVDIDRSRRGDNGSEFYSRGNAWNVARVDTETEDGGDDSFYYDYDDNRNKHQPGKGDPSCQMTTKYANYSSRPCRGGDYNGTSNGNEHNNVVNLTVFLGLPPYTRSLGYALTITITDYLDNHSLEYDVRLFPPDYINNSGSRFRFLRRNGQQLLAEQREIRYMNQLTNNTGTNGTNGEPIELIQYRLDSSIRLKTSSTWWWRHNITYECFWTNDLVENEGNTTDDYVDSQNDNLPERIIDPVLLRNITNGLYSILHTGVEELEEIVRQNNGRIRGISIEEFSPDDSYEDPDNNNTDGDGDPPSPYPHSPPNHPGGPSPVQPTNPELDDHLNTFVNVHQWDWLRYLGLAVFAMTVFGTCLLTQLSAWRSRRRTHRVMWGNLATEEGVSELLKTGWKIQGSKMEIFDKTQMGYRDDDSILMGGFETQVLGTEIAVTLEDSGSTPEHTISRA